METYDVVYFETLDSTNDYIKNHIDSMHDHTLVLAGNQTLGRGRRDKSWSSAPGMNFLGSFYKVKKPVEPYQAMIEGVLAAVLTLECFGVKPFIKPPNDVYFKDRKVAGILAEIIHRKKCHVIVGIGINVNEHKESPAIALSDVTLASHDLSHVTECVKRNMEKVESMSASSKLELFRDKIPFGRIYARNKEVHGLLESIEDSFTCKVVGIRVPCESLTFEYR